MRKKFNNSLPQKSKIVQDRKTGSKAAYGSSVTKIKLLLLAIIALYSTRSQRQTNRMDGKVCAV